MLISADIMLTTRINAWKWIQSVYFYLWWYRKYSTFLTQYKKSLYFLYFFWWKSSSCFFIIDLSYLYCVFRESTPCFPCKYLEFQFFHFIFWVVSILFIFWTLSFLQGMFIYLNRFFPILNFCVVLFLVLPLYLVFCA